MKLSIVVSIYNSQRYLDKCIASLVDVNNLQQYEVLLINDGSTDESETICNEYVKLYANFKYFKKENGGVSDARNYGLSNSVGDYVWFVDSDDSASKNLDILFEANFKDADIVLFDYYEVRNEKMILRNGFNSNRKLNCIVAPWNKIIKKKFINKWCGERLFDKGIIFEDYAIFPFLMAIAASIEYITIPLYKYTIERKGSLMNNSRFKQNDMIEASHKLLDKFKDNNLFHEYEKDLLKIVKPRLLDASIKMMLVDKKKSDDYYSRVCKFFENEFINVDRKTRGICFLTQNPIIIILRFVWQYKIIYNLISIVFSIGNIRFKKKGGSSNV